MLSHAIARFVHRLLNDTRGEDLTEKSSGLSNAGKVVIAAMAIGTAATGATALSNNANTASDTTSKNINGTIGAQTQQADKANSPFKVQ